MKALDRRVRRLEASLTPPGNEEVERLVALLRERRRRRLEASGEPFEVRPYKVIHDEDWPLSVADVLRMGRRCVTASNETPSRIATDITS
jgi:hypothetical protein